MSQGFRKRCRCRNALEHACSKIKKKKIKANSGQFYRPRKQERLTPSALLLASGPSNLTTNQSDQSPKLVLELNIIRRPPNLQPVSSGQVVTLSKIDALLWSNNSIWTRLGHLLSFFFYITFLSWILWTFPHRALSHKFLVNLQTRLIPK